MGNRERNRRIFLKSGLLGIGAGLYGLVRETIGMQFLYDINSQFENYFPIPEHAISSQMHGIIGNTFDTALDNSDEQIVTLDNAVTFGCSTQRLFLPDTFEPSLGVYNTNDLDRIKNTSETIYRVSKGKMKAGLCIFNGYRYWRSNLLNLVYNSEELLGGIYLPDNIASLSQKDAIAHQNDFFVNDEKINFFLRRCSFVLDYLKDTPIAYYEVINEPLVQARPNEARKVLTNWYQKVFTHIRKINKTVPLVTGTVRLSDVNNDSFVPFAPVIASVHDYPDITAEYVRDNRAFIPKKIPYGIFEIGIPSILGIPDETRDLLLMRYLESMLKSLTIAHVAFPSCIGLWQLNINRKDNFYLQADKFPKTKNLLVAYLFMLEKIKSNTFL